VGAWSLLLGAGVLLVLVGLFTHWTVILAGVLLPVWPVVSELLRRRLRRGEPPSEADDRRDVGE
jgi:hypothetical protein